MRLIDADDLLEQRVYTVAKGKGFPYREAYKNMLDDIEHAPTVEAEPIRHGHWIMCDEEYNAYECSICHDAWAVEEGSPSENNMHYCQNCGAKMDEEAGNDK